MTSLHERLSKKISWYNAWHKVSYYQKINWAILIIITVFFGLFLLSQTSSTYRLANLSSFAAPEILTVPLGQIANTPSGVSVRYISSSCSNFLCWDRIASLSVSYKGQSENFNIVRDQTLEALNNTVSLSATNLSKASIDLSVLVSNSQNTTPASTYSVIVNAQSGGFGYAYGPSMIKQDGIYHVFFCSTGGNGAWDYIREVTSQDGATWSAPVIKLKALATGGNTDLAACDPSVVYFNGYYYLYYSSAVAYVPNIGQTVIQVARSTNIEGPYLTYTARGTWEDTPSDPQVIIRPLVKRTTTPNGYGAGQQTVVAHNGQLYMWYYDDSVDLGQNLYFLTSTDPVHWQASVNNKTNLGANSVDVKFDAAHNQFVMLYMSGQHSDHAFLTTTTSVDGKTWNQFSVLVDQTKFPEFANNPGMLGDVSGNLLDNTPLVAFGAPYGLVQSLNWGQWNLYGFVANLASAAPPAPINNPPIGFLDGQFGDQIAGWAVDNDATTTSINVNLYVDGPKGVGTFVGSIPASVYRPDVNAALGVTGSHAFAWTIPSAYRESRTHTIYGYAVDSTDPTKLAPLNNSPKTFILYAPVTGGGNGGNN